MVLKLCLITILIIIVVGMLSNIFEADNASNNANNNKKGWFAQFMEDLKELGGFLAPWGVFFGLLLIAIVLVTKFVYTTSKNNRTSSGSEQMVMMPSIEEIRPIQKHQELEPKKMAIYYWYRPEGVRGGNPNLRRFSAKAVIERNDERVMKFTIEYNYNGGKQISMFEWDKENSYGTWSQDYPQDGGNWRLNQVSDTVFEGDCSDKNGSIMQMKLELI